MKRLKKLVSLLLVVVLCVTMTSTAFAKNVCVSVSGTSAKKTTFTVVTDSSWGNNSTITFTQSKGTMRYTNNAYCTSSVDTYAGYTIWVECKYDGGWKLTSYSWNYTKNFSIKLEKNRTYKISVTPYTADTVFAHCRSSSWLVRLRTAYMYGYDPSWKTNAKWSVKSTKKVSSCTIS